jgi:glycosyltransferase involved in cell wall biosynthesis
LEREAYAALSGMIVCGLDDRAFLSKHLSDTKKVFVLPNGYNEQFFNPEAFPRMLTDHPTVLFCGALDYSPNADAINWFADEIWPLIRVRQPEVEWLIIGKSPDERAERWRRLDGVNLIGEVPDVRPYYQKSWLQVVPLRIGGGTRLKIVESLGMHTPVVSTTVGAQGLSLVDGEDIVLADTPTAFADAVLDMLNSHDRRILMEQKGARTVNENYRWEQLGVKLNHYLKNL